MPKGKPKNSRDITPRIRWCLDESLKILEEKSGKDVAEHIADEMIEHGVGTVLKQFTAFIPKEMEMNLNHTHTFDTTALSDDDWSMVSKIREAVATSGTVTH